MAKKITTYHANLINGNNLERKTVRVDGARDAYQAFLLGDDIGRGLGAGWWTATVQRYKIKELNP